VTVQNTVVNQLDEFRVGNLLDGVRFSSSAGFIAFDIVARDEDTIAGYDFTRFKQSDIAHNYLLQVCEERKHKTSGSLP